MPHLLRWMLLFFLTGSLAAGGLLWRSYADLPDVNQLRSVELETPLQVFSKDGELIGEFGEKRRRPVRYAEIPSVFIDAFLAAEDDRFFSHHGVDLNGLVRAAWQLASSGHIQTGGSTITMQVAKNFFLSHERTFQRKFKEILLAVKIERELTKEEILELYLNKIFLGNRAYGIAAAAEVYYGQDIQALDLAQVAMIAGLPKAPSAYNPLVNPERAKIRRDWILQRMHSLGTIDESAMQSATGAPILAQYHGAQPALGAPHIAEMARSWMVERLGERAYTGGFRVYTTVNGRAQRAAVAAVSNGLTEYTERHGYPGPEARATQTELESPDQYLALIRGRLPRYPGLTRGLVTEVSGKEAKVTTEGGEQVTLGWPDSMDWARPQLAQVDTLGPAPSQPSDVVSRGDFIHLRAMPEGDWRLAARPQVQGALVALNPGTGGVEALVGGLNPSDRFNRATQAQRQPGSAFKPFIYAAALANGYSAASVINDAPIVFHDRQLEQSWRPENSSGEFGGPMRLREALYRSRNLVSIRLLQALTPATAIDYLSTLGFDAERFPPDLSLALGSATVSPMELTAGYAILANGGYRVEPYWIDRVEGADGAVIYQTVPREACAVCEQDLLPTFDDTIAQGMPETAPRVMDHQTRYLMVSMLKDVVRRGTGINARALGRGDIAGKTGTTNDLKDAWFAGFTPEMVAAVWVGYDEPRKLGAREYGSTAALPIWIDFMEVALAGRPEVEEPLPPGLVTVRIDPRTGLRASPGQSDAIFELFRHTQLPAEAPSVTTNSATGGDSLTPDELF